MRVIYTLRSTKDERAIIDLLNNQVQPSVEFLFIHLNLIRDCNRFTNSVLDHTHYTFYCFHTLVMLAQGDPELNGRELEVQGGDNLLIQLGDILPRSVDVQAGVNPYDSGNSSESKCSPEPSRNALSIVAVEKLQVHSSTG